jgi:hypothetical protein
MQAIRRMKIANYTLPLLLRKERRLRVKVAKPVVSDWQMHSKPDLQVY